MNWALASDVPCVSSQVRVALLTLFAFMVLTASQLDGQLIGTNATAPYIPSLHTLPGGFYSNVTVVAKGPAALTIRFLYGSNVTATAHFTAGKIQGDYRVSLESSNTLQTESGGAGYFEAVIAPQNLEQESIHLAGYDAEAIGKLQKDIELQQSSLRQNALAKEEQARRELVRQFELHMVGEVISVGMLNLSGGNRIPTLVINVVAFSSFAIRNGQPPKNLYELTGCSGMSGLLGKGIDAAWEYPTELTICLAQHPAAGQVRVGQTLYFCALPGGDMEAIPFVGGRSDFMNRNRKPDTIRIWGYAGPSSWRPPQRVQPTGDH